LSEPDLIKPKISIASNFNGESVSCFGAADGRLKANASGGIGSFTYTWSTGHKGPDLLDLKAGNYILVATDQNGCYASEDKTINDPVEVKAVIAEVSNFHGFGVSCTGQEDGFISAKGTGGTGTYNYKWIDSPHSGPIYSNLKAGTYGLIVTDQNGCSATTNTSITEPPLLTLTVKTAKNISCFDGNNGEISLNPTGGAGGYEFSLDRINWQTSSTLSGLLAKNYEIYVEDVNGCKATTTKSLTSPSKLVIAFENVTPAFCSDPTGGANAVVIGGTGQYYYSWTDENQVLMSDKSSISNAASGIYTLLVLDANNCEMSKAIGISSIDGPEVSVTNIAATSCSDSADGGARLEIAGGTGPYLYRWPDGHDTSEGNGLTKGVYLVEVIDNNKCKVVETVTIPGPESLEIELVEMIEPECHASCSGKIEVKATGGSGSHTFYWPTSSGSEINNLCAGSYLVEAIDGHGCSAQRSFTLSEPSAIESTLIHAIDPSCFESCDGGLEVVAVGGTGNLNYSWSTGDTQPLLSGLCAGTYTSTITDTNNCSFTAKYILQNPQPPYLNLGGSTTICNGQTHVLDGGTDWQTYLWGSNTGLTSSSQNITIESAGMYWLQVKNSRNCVAQDTFLLETSNELLNANFLLATKAVVEDTIVIIDISWPLPDQVVWGFPEEMKNIDNSADVVYGQFANPGTYEVSLLASLGECRDEITKDITIVADSMSVDEGRLGSDPFVKEYNMYPVPNQGQFEAEIELREESPVVLSVWSILTGKQIYRIADSGQKNYAKHFDLAPLTSGPYTLRLDYRKGSRYIRFIVH
jgi:hypothetical protein